MPAFGYKVFTPIIYIQLGKEHNRNEILLHNRITWDIPLKLISTLPFNKIITPAFGYKAV